MSSWKRKKKPLARTKQNKGLSFSVFKKKYSRSFSLREMLFVWKL
jgi:hypothetical protein